jgi:4-hydroxyphenylacetate decarboxylase small subunit
MCKDCKYYLPVDVFLGICKIDKQRIRPEDEPCEKVELLARCKFCKHYSAGNGNLGKCMGNTLAYPDMVAVKCADFGWQMN